MEAQEYINKNFADKQIKEINLSHFADKHGKFTGELIIQDYPNLEEIYLLITN